MPHHDGHSLAQRIRQIQQESGLADPRELAEKTLAGLADNEIRAALAEALPVYAREIVRTNRYNSMNFAAEATSCPTSSTPVQQRSWKAAAVKSWRKRLLTEGIDVSGGRGNWKQLGDCTRQDLLAAASYRHEIATRNEAMASKLEGLAGRLADGQTVADLSDDVLSAVLQPKGI